MKHILSFLGKTKLVDKMKKALNKLSIYSITLKLNVLKTKFMNVCIRVRCGRVDNSIQLATDK